MIEGIGEWGHWLNESLGHCYIFSKYSVRYRYSFDTICKQTQSPAPQICSSLLFTHVSWGTGILHATVISSFFVCRTANEWVNGSLNE